jgi:hypothetical protein
VFFDDYTFRVATISDASKVHVRKVVGEDHVRAELFKASLALGAGAVGVNHATDRGKVAGLEFGDCGADFGDTADDLMAGDAGIDSGHYVAPLVTDLMEVGVADTTEQYFDLNVLFA